MVCDVGPHSGIQRITFTSGAQTGPATVIVNGRTAYLRGDAFTMRVYFGFTKTQARKYAGKWISIPSSSPGFSTVSADATYPSYVSHLFPRGTLSLVMSGNLLGVRGTRQQQGVTIVATVFAPAHGKPLPVKATVTSPGHPGHGTVTMSRWGESVRVSAPRGAVPIATVRRS
jgi:hypothetical protein